MKKALDDLNSKVLGQPGISGTAVGQKGGKPCLKVYVENDAAGKKVPRSVGGVPVVVEKTGAFRRL